MIDQAQTLMTDVQVAMKVHLGNHASFSDDINSLADALDGELSLSLGTRNAAATLKTTAIAIKTSSENVQNALQAWYDFRNIAGT